VKYLPSCHVDKGDIFSRQLNKENQDTSVVGMTAVKNAETYAELEMLNKSAFAHPIFTS